MQEQGAASVPIGAAGAPVTPCPACASLGGRSPLLITRRPLSPREKSFGLNSGREPAAGLSRVPPLSAHGAHACRDGGDDPELL